MAKIKSARDIDIPKLPRGEGTISVFNDDLLVYKKVISVGTEKKRISVYGATIREVLDRMKVKEKELNKKKTGEIKETLSDAISSWLKLYKQPDLKPKSYDRIECTFKNQIMGTNLGNMRYQSIDNENIQEHLNDLVEKEYAWSTIKKVHDLLNEFYSYQAVKNNIEMNPMLLIKMPSKENVLKPEKSIEFFDEEDIRKFMIEATKMMKYRNLPAYGLGNAFVLMMFTGLRVGEAIALRWGDISLENKTAMINKSVERVINRNYDENNPELMKKKGIKKHIDVEGSTKNHSTRLLSLNKHALSALEAIYCYTKYKDVSDYVLATRDGGCNNIKNMTDRLNIIQAKAKTKVQNSGIHVLRHTAASMMFRKEIPIEIIAALLGHSVQVCRETYLHFVQEQKAEAVSRLDGFNFEIDI